MACSFRRCICAQTAQHGRNFKLIILAHVGNKQLHAATTFRCFSKGMVDFAGGDDRGRVRCAHPVDGGVDVVVTDTLATADDHGAGSDIDTRVLS